MPALKPNQSNKQTHQINFNQIFSVLNSDSCHDHQYLTKQNTIKLIESSSTRKQSSNYPHIVIEAHKMSTPQQANHFSYKSLEDLNERDPLLNKFLLDTVGYSIGGAVVGFAAGLLIRRPVATAYFFAGAGAQ